MRARLLLAPVLAGLLLTSCNDAGTDEPGEAPSAAEVMSTAKATLDETSGLRLTLSTDDLPEGVDGLLRAEGYATHDPAFEGDIVVRFAGIEPTVPVVAVDGTLYAQVPLTTGWSQVDPAEYGAPDPAGLLDPDTGFSSLLVRTEELAEGEQVRGGDDNRDILTTYAGSLPGEAVTGIIPSAEGDFDATYTVDQDGELRTMELTGDFYAAGSMTYTIAFDEYDATPSISAPE